MAWIAGHQGKPRYDIETIMLGRPANDLWDHAYGDCLVHLFPPNYDKGPSFKINSNVVAASPILSTRSANTSPNSQASPYFASRFKEENKNAPSARREPGANLAERSEVPPTASAPSSHSEAIRSPTSAAATRQKLVLDYSSTEPDPEELLTELYSCSVSTVTQQTKGSAAYFRFLHGIARMCQGQAMAHALAAMVATQQAKGTSGEVIAFGRSGLLSDFPTVPEGEQVTAADLQSGRYAPTITFYAATQVINWRYSQDRSSKKLLFVILEELLHESATLIDG